MSVNNRNIWIVIDHPLQLLMAISISKCLKRRGQNIPILLISRHEYWKYIRIQKYSKYFSRIYWFYRAGIPPFSMPKWKQFLASGMLFFELALTKYRVSRLKIKKDDVIMGLSGQQILENVILNVFKESQKVAILGEMDFSDETLGKRWMREGRVRYTIGGWFFKYIYSHLFNLSQMDVVFKKEDNQFTDADWLQTYTVGFRNIYNKILVLNNVMNYLKESGEKKIKNTYFPYLSRNRKTRSEKKVVFFGVPYVREWGITKKQYTDRINQYLEFIRKYFGKKYRLEYRPHPRENFGEIKLDIEGFNLDKDRNISELYLLDGSSSIRAVFSVSSVSSRSSLNFGIDSYIYPDLFPLKLDLIRNYKEIFGHVPKEFSLKNFKSKPEQIKFNFRKYPDPISVFEDDLFWAIGRDN